MSALSIALKDIQITLKDRGALIQLFLLPLLFIVAYSAVAAAFEAGDVDARIPLPVVDLDGGSEAQALLDALDMAGGVQVELIDEGEAQQKLEASEIARHLTIPEDFTEGILEGRTVTLRLISHPDANLESTEAVRLVVEGVAQDMALESQILASLQQMGEMQANAPPEYQEAFAAEKLISQAQSQFTQSRDRPLVTIAQSVPGQESEKEELPGTAEVAVPGFTVLFVFLTAQATARSIYDEKKLGSFRRLMAAPISKASLLAGKIVPNFITALIQVAVIFVFGVFGLGLLGFTPVKLGNDPLALVITILLIALCSSALGVVIAALARTESQISGLSTFLLWGLGTLGGSIIPYFILENMLGPIPRALPHYWANKALDDIMVRGMMLADVSLALIMLLGFTLVFFVVGLWRFDFD
ncbi:MAG: ABC transporter permease [Anaerolineaceae bacterium]|nr:MAG: ABC transporter permease [Anaerolineaceae bacterium]